MTRLADASRLFGTAYDAALEPKPWPSVLDSKADFCLLVTGQHFFSTIAVENFFF